MLISKSMFVDYMESPKLAWWKYNNIDIYKKIKGIDDDSTSDQLIELGQTVEDLVGEYFFRNEGATRKDVFKNNTAKNPLDEEDEDIYLIQDNYQVERERNITQTIEAIKNKAPLIYQPGFFIDGLYVRGDYLKLNKNSNYDIIEVKAKTSVRNINKTKCKLQDKFLYDISFQKYVINKVLQSIGAGEIENFYYAYLNKKYKKNGDINVSQLIVLDKVNIKKDIENSEGDMIEVDDTLMTDGVIEGRIKSLKEELVLNEKDFNKLHPFNGSKYTEYFGKDREFGTIFGKGLTSKNAVKELYSRGKVHINNLDLDEQELFNKSNGDIGTARKYIINYLKAKQHGDLIDKESIKEEFEDFKFPLCFYDYETCSVPVPFLDNTGPYQQVIVQYSLHKVYKDGKIKHYGGILTGTGEKSVKNINIKDNPNQVDFESEKVITGSYIDILEEFLEDVGEDIDKTFIVWYKPFENTRNKEVAETFSQLKESFIAINNNTYDLMDIFKKGLYYSLDFKGSNSIKYVLPVMVPSMSYEGMDIPNGLEAMQVLNSIINTDKYNTKEKKKQIENLLLYCGQDSLAMFKIYYKLLKFI